MLATPVCFPSFGPILQSIVVGELIKLSQLKKTE